MPLYFIYIATGALVGTMAGLLGIAGGIIIIPVLALTFTHANIANGIEMHVAAGTALAAVSVTTIFSTISHHRRHNILWPLFWTLIPGIVTGTIMGALLAAAFPNKWLATLFADFLLATAIYMLIFPYPRPHWRLPSTLILVLFSIGIGIISGLFGLGGGIIIAPLLITFNVSATHAAGTAAACGIPITIMGSIIYIFTGWLDGHCLSLATCGYINWPAAFAIAIGGIIFIPFGAFLSRHLPVDIIKKLFIILMMLAAIRMFWI